jgi:hypothetical protein
VSWTPSFSSGIHRLIGEPEVSCVSAIDCTSLEPFSDQASLWNGSSWSAEQFPVGVGPVYGAPQGLSCTSHGFCVAVGTYEPQSSDIQYGHQIAQRVMSGSTYPVIAMLR